VSLCVFRAPLNDEFDVNGKPNSEIWNYNVELEIVWGNGELQYYTDRTEM
jgi:hypothetical protein